jgi:hypothetical protein
MLSNNHKQPSHNDRICQERLRQARWSFNLYFAFTGISGILSLIGVALLLKGCISQDKYATLGGVTLTVVSHRVMKHSREANNRLDRLQANKND